MIKRTLNAALAQAWRQAADDWGLDTEAIAQGASRLKLERPRVAAHGDYAMNASPLARLTGQAPPRIAQTLCGYLRSESWQLEVVGGFLNIRVQPSLLLSALSAILHSPAPGANTTMANEAILLEYVSANPTGPLHIGHGRWAALGDSLARVFRHCGAVVTPEFYINDAGVQMDNIALSLLLRCVDLMFHYALVDAAPFEALGADCTAGMPFAYPYPGEYVAAMALQFVGEGFEQGGEIADQVNMTYALSAWTQVQETLQAQEDTGRYTVRVADRALLEPFRQFARTQMLAEQQALLARMDVHFEAWFSEKEMLHERGLVTAILNTLRQNRFCYEKDGALWLQSSELGDEKDRVLVKSDGEMTYLAADVAYHDQKFRREDDAGTPQYTRFINIWGADHHGYMARMRAALTALGHLATPDDPRFEVLLGQLVNLIVDGEKTRMGKRRRMLTLADVVDEVGVDAVRFWMVSKSADTTLDFDVDLAQSATQDNPVFYAQYAHARCAGILRNAVAPTPTAPDAAEPFVSQEALAALTRHPDHEALAPLFEQLDTQQALATLRELILRLDGFEALVSDAARLRAPHMVARYALDVAADFHSLYAACRILTPDASLTRARLALILALQKTLAQALSLLGVSAPETM